MSAKLVDYKGRWRHRTVAFRVSEEEAQLIDREVALSGLTKQDYITKRLLNRDVVVQGNPRVYKALRDQMADMLAELRRIETYSDEYDELMVTIRMIASIMDGMKEDGLCVK